MKLHKGRTYKELEQYGKDIAHEDRVRGVRRGASVRAAIRSSRSRMSDEERAQDTGFDDVDAWREWFRTRREYERARKRGDRDEMDHWRAEHRKWGKFRRRKSDGEPYTQIDE